MASDPEECNFVGSDMDDTDNEVETNNLGKYLKDTKVQLKVGPMNTQSSIIHQLQADLEGKQKELFCLKENLKHYFGKYHEQDRGLQDECVNSLESIGEFMSLSLDGIRVLQIDLINAQEQIVEEQNRAWNIAEQLKCQQTENKDQLRQIQMYKTVHAGLLKEIQRLRENQGQMFSPSHNPQSPYNDFKEQNFQEDVMGSIVSQNTCIQQEIKKLHKKISEITKSPSPNKGLKQSTSKQKPVKLLKSEQIKNKDFTTVLQSCKNLFNLVGSSAKIESIVQQHLQSVKYVEQLINSKQFTQLCRILILTTLDIIKTDSSSFQQNQADSFNEVIEQLCERSQKNQECVRIPSFSKIDKEDLFFEQQEDSNYKTQISQESSTEFRGQELLDIVNQPERTIRVAPSTPEFQMRKNSKDCSMVPSFGSKEKEPNVKLQIKRQTKILNNSKSNMHRFENRRLSNSNHKKSESFQDSRNYGNRQVFSSEIENPDIPESDFLTITQDAKSKMYASINGPNIEKEVRKSLYSLTRRQPSSRESSLKRENSVGKEGCKKLIKENKSPHKLYKVAVVKKDYKPMREENLSFRGESSPDKKCPVPFIKRTHASLKQQKEGQQHSQMSTQRSSRQSKQDSSKKLGIEIFKNSACSFNSQSSHTHQ